MILQVRLITFQGMDDVGPTVRNFERCVASGGEGKGNLGSCLLGVLLVGSLD